MGSRFESLISSHHLRLACECHAEKINDDDDDEWGVHAGAVGSQVRRASPGRGKQVQGHIAD